ncbi:MAG: alpha/beta fold hydrolase [Pseudomonadota bacterium]
MTIGKSFIPRFLVALLFMTPYGQAMAAEPDSLEETVCGALMEPFAFWTWSRLAGKPDPTAAQRIPNAEALEHKTRDGRRLRGYRLKPLLGERRGTVLVAQGNAMLADQVLPELVLLAQAGLEVYVFDYRGYGQSEGKRRLKAMVSDYRELAERIRAASAGPHHLYGISFGGIVLLNVVGSGVGFDRAVIDSTPARLSSFGCPERYDPVANLPQDAHRFLFLAGGRDSVVPLRMAQELIDLARARGGRIELRPEWAHPFMDADYAIHRARFEHIRDFLAGSGRPMAP